MLFRSLRALAWAVWLSGLGLSVAAVLGFVPGLVASGAALVICFCPFAFFMGRAEGRRNASRHGD